MLFELRATTGMGHVDRELARQRLPRLVERLNAEDDCPDLRKAQALLGTLGAAPPG